MIAFRGKKKVGPRPDWSPLGILITIFDEHACPFHMRVPSPGVGGGGGGQAVLTGEGEGNFGYCEKWKKNCSSKPKDKNPIVTKSSWKCTFQRVLPEK